MQDRDGGYNTYAYDERNALTTLTNPSGEVTTWQYDPVGRITTLTHGNGLEAATTYNAVGWATQVVNAKSDGTTISSFDYTHDDAGNPTLLVEANGDKTTWAYDALGQLTEDKRSGDDGYDREFTYDAVGNSLTASGTTYTYDAADQLVGEDDDGTLTTFTYDDNGNLSVRDSDGALTTLTWGYEDEMVGMERSSTVVTMTYDGDLKRRRREAGSAARNYVWDAERILLETGKTHGTTIARYTQAPMGYGDLVSQVRQGATSFYHFDALGSVRELTDADEDITDTYVYRAFGLSQASTGSTTNFFRWVGRLGYYAEPRLFDGYLLRRRYYVPQYARFVSRDRVPGKTNRYSYADNRPTVLTDPTGLFTTADCYRDYLKCHQLVAKDFAPCLKDCVPFCVDIGVVEEAVLCALAATETAGIAIIGCIALPIAGAIAFGVCWNACWGPREEEAESCETAYQWCQKHAEA